MFLKKSCGPRTAVLSDGSVLTLADLPPPDVRWVASRKAAVVRAVAYGLLPRGEALTRYALTEEEFASWETAVAHHGVGALKVTALQRFRQPKVDFQQGEEPGNGILTFRPHDGERIADKGIGQ